MRRRRLLAEIRKPKRKEMQDAVNRAISHAAHYIYQYGYVGFHRDEWHHLTNELMQFIDRYADTVYTSSLEWRTGDPIDRGFYLAAYRLGNYWQVSELWYNPSSAGPGWWRSRVYLEQRDYTYTPVEVVAWMPMPRYTPWKI